MNKFILLGRLTKEPEIKYSSNDVPIAIATFGIAYNRIPKNDGKEETDYFNCVAFGKQAEFIGKFIKKGMKVLLTTKVENNNYVAKDGSKVFGIQLIVEEIEPVESKNRQQIEDKEAL